jgi:hypothetical protein
MTQQRTRMTDFPGHMAALRAWLGANGWSKSPTQRTRLVGIKLPGHEP